MKGVLGHSAVASLLAIFSTRHSTHAVSGPLGNRAVGRARACIACLDLIQWRAFFATVCSLHDYRADTFRDAVTTGLGALAVVAPLVYSTIHRAGVFVAGDCVLHSWASQTAIRCLLCCFSCSDLPSLATRPRACGKLTPRCHSAVDWARLRGTCLFQTESGALNSTVGRIHGNSSCAVLRATTTGLAALLPISPTRDGAIDGAKHGATLLSFGQVMAGNASVLCFIDNLAVPLLVACVTTA